MAERDGGRHVVEIDERLVDGENGYTCAQYINSAYRVEGCSNNAEMLDGGTIRVMKGKVIHEGAEILMAYHAGYWSRWEPSRTRKRKGSGAVVTVGGGVPLPNSIAK